MMPMIAASVFSPRNADATAAMIRINTSGLENSCKRSEKMECCCVAAGSFGPNLSSRAWASCAVKPEIAALAPSVFGDMLGFPTGNALQPFKDWRGNHSKDETADVRQISDATALHIRHAADLTEKLNDKPGSNQDRSGNNSNAGVKAKQNQRAYLIMRVGYQKRAHDARDRTAGAQV